MDPQEEEDLLTGFRNHIEFLTQLEQLSAELRIMKQDRMLVDFVARERKFQREPRASDLHYYLEEYEKKKNLDNHEEFPCLLDTLPPFRHVFWPIVDYLSQVGLYGPIFEHFSRFAVPPCEKLVRAFEKLQYQICERQDYLLYWLWDRPGPPPRQKLDSFRLAQKIRNEHGFSLDDRPQNCFRSFEDLVHLERSIEADDAVDFLLQCVALKAIQPGTLQNAFYVTKNLAQLTALHNGVIEMGAGYFSSETVGILYFRRSDHLMTERRGVRPKWREVKKYLKTVSKIRTGATMLCGAEILDEELDEALNCVLNTLLRLHHYSFGSWKGLVLFFKQLLDRGASLWFKAADEESSSMAALLELARVRRGYFQLSEFSAYLCCPLSHENWQCEMRFDSRRLTPLRCLAARAVPRSGNPLEVPRQLRFFIEAHQELRSKIG